MNPARPGPREYDRWKRRVDVVVAAAGLILTAPIQLVTAVAVALDLGRPVLFRQLRPGLEGRPFTLVKFRTMADDTESSSVLVDAERLTDLGRVLRSTSLDELPTLWNVLKGEMSLVGPRPLLVEYLGRYTADQARRHEVRPGITGLAQVTGRNRLSWETKFDLDVDYVDQRSWRLDLRILAATLGRVLRREGVCAPGDATMPAFLGGGGSTGSP